MGKNLSQLILRIRNILQAWFYIDEDTGVIMPGKYDNSGFRSREQVATDILRFHHRRNRIILYNFQNCPHIVPPYPEGATIKDVKVQGQLLRQWLMTAQTAKVSMRF